MNECVLTPDDVIAGIPACVEKMKAAGFRFLRDECPIALSGNFVCDELPDGTFRWRQWFDA